MKADSDQEESENLLDKNSNFELEHHRDSILSQLSESI